MDKSQPLPSPWMRWIDAGDNSARGATLAVLAVLLATVFLLRAMPIWTIGLYQDDAVISGYSSDALLQGRSLWEYCVALTGSILRFQGRIAPVFGLWMMPLQSSLVDNLFLYRVIQSLGQLLALGCFGLFVRALTKDVFAALLCVVICASVFEVRDYHDPSHAIFILMPYLIAVGSLACLFAISSAEAGSAWGWRFWMVPLFNGAGILMYEMAVPLGALSCLLLLGMGPFSWRVRLSRAMLAGSPVLVVIAVGMVAKAMISSYEGTMVGSMSPAVVMTAYGKHLTAAVPLSYWWYDPHRLFGDLLVGTRSNPASLLSAGAIAIAIGLASFLALVRSTASLSAALVVSGATLLLLPSMLVAVSLKYQREAVAGVGYLQNALSYLGTSILVFSALVFLCAMARRRGLATLVACALLGSAALGLVGAISLVSSHRVASAINDAWRHPREQMEVWLAATRSTATEGAVIALDRGWLNRWEWPPFLQQHWGIRGSFAMLKDVEAGAPGTPPGRRGVVALRPAGKTAPSDLGLFVDTTSSGGRTQVRAIVMSTNRDRLSASDLRLARGAQSWPIPGTVIRGRYGYHYRQAVFTVDSAGVRDFSLVLSPPGTETASATPAALSPAKPAVEWVSGRYADGWSADRFEIRARSEARASYRVTLANPSGPKRDFVLEGAARTLRGTMAPGSRAVHVIELAPGQSLRGTVSPAFVPREAGAGADDRSLGLRIEVEAMPPG